MAKRDDSKKPKISKSKNAPKSVEFNLDGNVDKSVIVVGDKATVNYYAAVSANTKQNDPDFWNLKHPYPMPPNFTGRIEERALLTQWLDGDSENRLFILRALGGFGKSALAWQWLTHDVNPKTWKKVIFWSFYEGDASFEHFVEETLKYLNREVPQGKRDQVEALLRAMQSEVILLIVDGFERALRAYNSMNAAYQGDEEPKLDDNQLDCTDLNAEIFLKSICSLPKIQSKALMTTRLTPRAVKPRGEFMLGCREVELTAMQKEDAVAFFHKQGIQGNRVEIESACDPYGYHPLSLRLLAGRIVKDFQNPGDISVAQKLKMDGDIIQQKHHVLEVSYSSLPEQEKKLLGTIACFRSPVEYQTLQSIAENKDALEIDLNDLIERGILYRMYKYQNTISPVTILDLHPIVRSYAYNRLTVPVRTGTHKKLISYFESIIDTGKIKKTEDLSPVIELYHHTIRANEINKAYELFRDRLHDVLYYQLGAYQINIELLEPLLLEASKNLPTLHESHRAWIFAALGNAYSMSGHPLLALPLFERQVSMRQKMENKRSLATGLGNIAYMAQIQIGKLINAEKNLQHSIDLCRELRYEYREVTGLIELSNVLSYLGKWRQAKEALELAWKVNNNPRIDKGNHNELIWINKAHRLYLLGRDKALPVEEDETIIKCANRALKHAQKTAKVFQPYVRDFIIIHWLLGAGYRINNKFVLAEENLSKALNLCRQINAVDHEADILLDLARLRYAQGDFKDALEKATEALVITERSGYVLQGADVNLFLAQYALEQEKDNAKAKVYAEEAKKLATCDGPPYYYKVAYEEAEAMLEKLK